jgi:hypothetical protein
LKWLFRQQSAYENRNPHPPCRFERHNPLLREGTKKAENHRPKILTTLLIASKKLIEKGLNWPVLTICV